MPPLGPVTLLSSACLPLPAVPCCLLQVYNATTQPLIQKVVGGFNSTVFAYGQTSSGKTHTMRGTEQEPGIIPLAVREIFDHIGSMQDREFLLRVSYMEVCNPFAFCLSCACHEAGLELRSPAEVQIRPCAAQSMQPPNWGAGIKPAACAARGPGSAKGIGLSSRCMRGAGLWFSTLPSVPAMEICYQRHPRRLHYASMHFKRSTSLLPARLQQEAA